MFEVTVRTLDGRDSVFSLEDDHKVKDFKEAIQLRLDVPVDQQRLIFRGRVLQDDARLLDCDVQDKVVHLVSRPPPTQSEQDRNADAPTQSSTTTNIPWGGLDMQQTFQYIASDLFGELGPFGRPLDISVNTPGGRRGDFLSSSSLVAREATFNRLYRQASHLLRRISRHPLSTVMESSTDPLLRTQEDATGVDHDVTVTDVDDNQESPSSDTTVTNDATTSPSASNIDASACSSETNNRVPSSEAVQPSVVTSTVRPISMLADMISKHRRLWRSVEPHLDQWESMLNEESRVQESLSHETTDSNNATTEEANQATTLDEPVLVPSVQTVEKSLDVPIADAPDTDIQRPHEWQHRFFTQVSRLLHMHAHMLHLISDFSVISIGGARTPRGSSDSTTPVSSGDVNAQNVPTEPSVPTTTIAETTSSSDAAIPSTDEPRRRQPLVRRLCVPHGEGVLIRTRVDTEPVVSSVPTESGTATVTSERPRSRADSSAQPQRRRSQSALDVQRGLIGSRPVFLPVTSSGTRFPGIPTMSTSTRPGPLNTGGAAIVRRVDIPLISMNLVNLPMPQPAQTGNLTRPPPPLHTDSSLPSITINPTVAPPPYTLRQGFTGAPLRDTMITIPTLPGATSLGPTDPFLMCHSRHFSHHHHPFAHPGGRLSINPVDPANIELVSASSTGSSAANAPPTEVDVPNRVTSTPETNAASTNATSASQQRPSESLAFTDLMPMLSQHIASAISAATSAATSVVNASGFDMGGLNIMVSPPTTFDVDSFSASISGPRITSTDVHTTASGPTQHISWVMGHDNPLLSSMRVGNPTVVPSGTGNPPVAATQTPLPIPTWASPQNRETLPTPDELRVVPVFFSGLLATVWDQISRLASRANVNTVGLNSDVSIPPLANIQDDPSRVAMGFLSDTLTSVRSITARNASDISFDGLRAPLNHFVRHAETAMVNNWRVVDTLANAIFTGQTTDEALPAESAEYRNMKWITPYLRTDRVTDLRASLVNFLKPNIAHQMYLWRISPTDSGFGTTFLCTLEDICCDILCLVDILTNALAVSSGFLPPNTEGSSGDPRLSLVGFNSDFSQLTTRLEQLVSEMSSTNSDESNEDVRSFFRMFLTSIQHCIDQYHAMDFDTFKSRWDRIRRTGIADRALPNAMDVDLRPDDPDMDDLPYLDASSELPIPNGGSETSIPDDNTAVFIGPLSGRVSPLPDWSNESGDITLSVALRPHQNRVNTCMHDGRTQHNPEGWNAVVSPEWVNVISDDIRTMAQTTGNSHAESFSDAYIAGMPAKRRKIMQANSEEAAQTPDVLFAHCLSDAIRVSASDSTAPSSQTPVSSPYSEHQNDLPNDKPVDLLLPLQDMVSQQIATRLSRDPDFDPARFPLSNRMFLEKRTPHEA